MTKIEEIARAIAPELWRILDRGIADPELRDDCRDRSLARARDALQALLPPSKEGEVYKYINQILMEGGND